MPDPKEISIKLTAKDETASAFASLQHRMKEAFGEGGVGGLMEMGIKGIASIAAIEAVTKSIEVGTNALKDYDKAVQEMGADADNWRTIAGSAVHAFEEGVPVLGSYAKAVREAADALKDHAAMALQDKGATDAEINAHRSDNNMWEYSIRNLHEAKSARDILIASTEALAVARARERGATAEALEIQAKEIERGEKLNAIREQAKQYLLNEHIIDQTGKQIHNPTELQKGIIDNYSKALNEAQEAGDRNVNEVHNRYRKQRGDEDRDLAKQAQAEAFKHNEDLKDIEAQALAQRLRANQQNGEADLVLLRRQHEREIEESKKAENDATVAALQAAAKRAKERGDGSEIAGGNAEANRIQQRAAAERQAMDEKFAADQAKLKQDTANQSQDEADQRRHTLAGMRLEILKEEASMGNMAAKAAADTLGIQEKYNEKKAEANRLLRESTNLSDADRKAIQEDIAKYDKLQAAALARMKMGRIDIGGNPFAQTGELGMGDTGMREAFAAARQSVDDRQLAMQQKMVDAIIEGNKKTDTLINNTAALRDQQPANLGAA